LIDFLQGACGCKNKLYTRNGVEFVQTPHLAGVAFVFSIRKLIRKNGILRKIFYGVANGKE